MAGPSQQKGEAYRLLQLWFWAERPNRSPWCMFIRLATGVLTGPAGPTRLPGAPAVAGEGESMRRRLLVAAMAYLLVGCGVLVVPTAGQAAATSPTSPVNLSTSINFSAAEASPGA